MIVLDTNVLSELVRPRPAPAVIAWANGQPLTLLLTTAVTAAELLYGVAVMAEGKRRTLVERAVGALLSESFAGRILPFDEDAARAFAAIAADRRRTGRPIDNPDAQIAAIARSRGASVATRNTADFIGCGIELIDPWHA